MPDVIVHRFTILGAIRSKKNSQRIARTKDGTPFIMQSAESNLWAEKAAWQLRQQWHSPPIRGPVNLAAVIYAERRGADLLNLLANISDVLEAPSAKQKLKKRKKPWPKASILVNDRQVVSLDGSRLLKDKDRPRVEITLTVLEEAQAELDL